jgi:hypothetical protein
MFNIKDEFICNYCYKIQKNPTFLPCRCSSVCKHHTTMLGNNGGGSFIITCNHCRIAFDKCKDFFKENEPLRKLIVTDFHLSDDEKKLKSLLESYIQDLEVSVKNLSQKCAEFSVTQYDHFANIRREIDIKRETIIKEIYERYFEEDEGVDNDDVVDEDEEEVERNKNEIKFNAKNDALVEDIHRYSSDMLYQLERVEEAFRANFNKVKINLMTEIDVELEKTNVSEFMRSPNFTKVEIHFLNIF